MEIIRELIPITIFVIGFFMGFKIGKDKELPEINPVKVIENKVNELEAKKEISELEEYLENIENYPNNQRRF